MKLFLAAIIVLIVIVVVGEVFKKPLSSEKESADKFMDRLILKSSAFQNNDFIPKKFTCAGENINPPLEIGNVPEGARSLVLIMDDPDARLPMSERGDGGQATGGVTWDHWLLWNIPPETQSIKEDDVPIYAVQGTTSFGDLKYGGPCPPASPKRERGELPGKAHRYMFKLYALDRKLSLTRGAVKSEIEKAMEENILAETVLIGLYERK